jgi:glycosyltransferase involved in cell wall biosynthesis
VTDVLRSAGATAVAPSAPESSSKSRPLRVAFVTDAVHPYHRGGKEVRYYEVARRLTRHPDVEITVYTMKWWRGGRQVVFDDVRYVAIAPYRNLYSGPRRSFRQAILFALCCLTMIARSFDVIEADHMPYMQLFPLRLVTWLRRRPLVVTWHEVWGPSYWKDYLGRPGAVGWALERISMLLPDGIVAASRPTADRLRPYLRSATRVTVAPNGVDLDLIDTAPAVTDWSGDVITVGRLLPHKRVDLLLDALALLRDRDRPLRCLIIGDGPVGSDLRERADRLGLGDDVAFDSRVDTNERLYGLLRAARAFAFPSEREGFGIAVLEALACGLPVVTTSAPDNLARHLVAADPASEECDPNPEAFAAALERAVAQGPLGDPHASPTRAPHPVATDLDSTALGLDAATPGTPGWIDSYNWEAVSRQVLAACRESRLSA